MDDNEKVVYLRKVVEKLACVAGIDIEIPENPSKKFLEDLIKCLDKLIDEIYYNKFNEIENDIINMFWKVMQSYAKKDQVLNPVTKEKKEQTQKSPQSPS